MKKLLAFTMTFLMLFSSLGVTAWADEPTSAKVIVTMSNKGELVMTQEEVTVTDLDMDGILTIHEALYAAHEAFYPGGAAAGYAASSTPLWGLSVSTLWGDTSGDFSYYRNNQSAWNLEDTIAEGDYISAFVYKDGNDYSDLYCWFDENTVSVNGGEAITLTLTGADVDENWNPITVPVAGATITINGEKTKFVTDAEGKVTLTIDAGGSYVISAVSDSRILVPAVCKATVVASTNSQPDTDASQPSESKPEASQPSVSQPEDSVSEETPATPNTGDTDTVFVFALLGMVALSGMVLMVVKGKKANEK